jgi:hypothetical protein
VRPPSEHVGLPEGLEDAIMQALARDPGARPASAGQLARKLDPSVLSSRPTEVLRRPETRRPRVVSLAAAAVLLVSAAAALVAFQDGGERVAPPPVEPVPSTGAPAQDARSLARWLRENSG